MKQYKKIAISLVSLILCLSILFPIFTISAHEEETKYVKDLKIIYADSIEEAKEQLPSGYQLVDGNINAGTKRDGVYVCYSTTTDPDEAITDIKVMHESGGFERTDFSASLEKALDGVYALAADIVIAVEEFAQNYRDGVPSAVYAKDVLNYFAYDENTLLGDYMVSGKGTYREYGQMILMCHEDILNPILSLLSMGVQQRSGENWIDKLADVDPSSYDSSDDAVYRERAVKLRTILQQFNDVYCYINGYDGQTYSYNDLTDDNDKDFFVQMSENKDMFILIQGVLQSYPVGVDSLWGEYGCTAEDLFTIGLNESLNLHESYAILDCLTPGQEIMLRVGGVYNFLISTQNTQEVLDQAIGHIKSEIPEGENIPIWDGVNLDIFSSEVALTTEAQRSIATGKQYDLFTRDVDTLKQHYRNIATVITSAVSIAACSVLVVKCALPLLTLTFTKAGFMGAAATVSAFAASAVVSGILFYAGISFMVVGIVCAIIMLFFLDDIINWLASEDYERTSIPKYMVDEVLTPEGVSTYTYYRRVDNVKTDDELDLDIDDNESGSDINMNEGYRWMALYTSNKGTAGNPIEADMLVVQTTPSAPNGYAPVSMFGKNTAVNLNSYADQNSAKYTAIYMYFKQEARATVLSEKVYIGGLKIEQAVHEDVAKKDLIDSGYIPLDYNFSPDQDSVIYIGYRLTSNPDDAVRDIRLLYDFNGTSIKYGQLDYGSIGKIGLFDVMVSSTSKNPAPPIVGIKVFKTYDQPDEALGYEPVNEFSGGKPITLGRNNYKIYFIPETTFTEGEDYLAGIETDVYYYNGYTQKVGRSWEKRYYVDEDKYGNNYDTYKEFKNQKYGEQFFDFSLKSTFNRYGNKNNWSDSNNIHILSYKYTTTKNPYRALYGISATVLGGLEQFNDSISYAGIGHVLAPVEFNTNSWYYSNTDFPYAPDQNMGDLSYQGKSDYSYQGGYVEWEAIHSRYDIANMDVTQSLLSKEDANALYLAGYQQGRNPLKPDDILLTTTRLAESEIPKNFTAVDSMIGSDTTPTNIAPTNAELKIGTDFEDWGFTEVDVMFRVFPEPVYLYYRNEKTVNGEVVAQKSLKEGKYISGVFIASREEIREQVLSSNEEIECKDIMPSLIESNLLSKGATVTYNIHIGSNFSAEDEFENANYTYFGVSRTDDISLAIRDIRLYIAEPGEVPTQKIKRTITKNGFTFDVDYTLTNRISLTEEGNKSDEDCAEEKQVYVYVSTHPSLGDPITDVIATTIFKFGSYEPIRTMNDEHLMTAYINNDGADIFIDDDYFLEGNYLAFRRTESEQPYISEIVVAQDNNKATESISKLFEAGCTDIVKQDLNENAGGDYIYIGLKRTADKNNAVYDIVFTNDQKNPPSQIGNLTLVSPIDLNDGAAGKYIYMYQNRTPDKNGQSPLTDISFYGKNPQDSSYNEGFVTYYKKVAVNTDGDMQDLNQSCGFWSDYIYLIKHYSIEPSLPGSLIGTGSIVVILLLACVMAGAGLYVVKKNKKENSNGKSNTNVDSNTK